MYPFLKGERVYLRQLTDDDCKGRYLEWFNDAEVCAGNSHHVRPFNRQDALDYVYNTEDLVLAIITEPFHEMMGMEVKWPDGGFHIGNVALQNIHPVYRSADFSIIIGEKDYWGKGYGKEVATLIINHGFMAMGLLRIACATFDTNHAMRGLAKSLGFREEGNRLAAVYKNGEFLNIIEYGLLTEGWKENR